LLAFPFAHQYLARSPDRHYPQIFNTMAETKLPDARIPSIEQDDIALNNTSLLESIPEYETLEGQITE
jgi:hypothetical protein